MIRMTPGSTSSDLIIVTAMPFSTPSRTPRTPRVPLVEQVPKSREGRGTVESELGPPLGVHSIVTSSAKR